MAKHVEMKIRPGQYKKYNSFETADGDVVVYDRDTPTAWLQSDTLFQIKS